MKKKLSSMNLEKQQLDEKQQLNVLGGSDVNWCDCFMEEIGSSDSVSTWHATPDPTKPGGNPASAGAQQPGIDWCDSGVAPWKSTPPPC